MMRPPIGPLSVVTMTAPLVIAVGAWMRSPQYQTPSTAHPTILPERKMHEAVREFLALLDTEQRRKTVFAFNSEERLNWHYVPRDRQGLPYKAMTPTQQKAAVNLLRRGLSQKGFQKTATIRELETVLREIEQGRGPVRDRDLFYFTVFGEPSEKGAWGWRYEGHHISLHWTYIDGRLIADTPQFLGANPAEVRQGPMKGTRVLAAEEDLARVLVQSLNVVQRKEAILSETAPPDILTRADRQAAMQEDRGIAYRQLTREQQGMLLQLIREHAGAQPQEQARQRLAKIRQAGLEGVKFAWMGGLERGQGHYYRIQGPTFLVEYDNTQNDANHIHSVWRDFRGDFGRDLLAEHYKQFPHR